MNVENYTTASPLSMAERIAIITSADNDLDHT